MVSLRKALNKTKERVMLKIKSRPLPFIFFLIILATRLARADYIATIEYGLHDSSYVRTDYSDLDIQDNMLNLIRGCSYIDYSGLLRFRSSFTLIQGNIQGEIEEESTEEPWVQRSFVLFGGAVGFGALVFPFNPYIESRIEPYLGVDLHFQTNLIVRSQEPESEIPFPKHTDRFVVGGAVSTGVLWHVTETFGFVFTMESFQVLSQGRGAHSFLNGQRIFLGLEFRTPIVSQEAKTPLVVPPKE